MNKNDLATRIAASCHLSRTQATDAITAMTDTVTAALRKGDRVALLGFGTFSIAKRQARMGRNPQTGKTIKISARSVAKFSAGAALKKAVRKAA